MHDRAALNFASLSGCEQMAAKPTHIDDGVLDLMLTNAHDPAGVPVGSRIGTSDHGALFIDVALEQHIPYLVCRQEIYLENFVYCDLV